MKNGEFPASALAEIPWAKGKFVAKAWLGAVIVFGEAFKAAWGVYPAVTDAYRNIERQTQLYKDLGYPKAAYPGESNHGLGKSIDWASGINNYGSPRWKWMNTEGRKLGWVPLNERNLTFEPWHWTPTKQYAIPEEDDMLTQQDIIDGVAIAAERSPVFRRAMVDLIWGTTISRGDKQISVLQEIADIKTLGMDERTRDVQRDAAVSNLRAAVEKIQAGESFDPAKLVLGVKEAMREVLGDSIEIEIIAKATEK